MTLNNLKHEAEKIRLTSAERSAMRARIFGAPSTLPVRHSPYVFVSHLRMVLAGVAIFVLAGTGTVSAAQGALPGDLLYPVKVSINEKVEVALAPTAAAKAEVQVRLASRRVEEAQALAARGRLDIKTAETLAINFDEHATQAVALAEVEDDAAAVPAAKSADATGIASGAPAPQEGEAARATMSIAVPAEPGEGTTMVQIMIEATTTLEKKKDDSLIKKPERRGALKEMLRAKGEILRELKSHASSSQDGRGAGRESD